MLFSSTIFKNVSYLSTLQVFLLLAPLITYPYLIGILGIKLYGLVISAQVAAGYCSIVVDYGFQRTGVRYISINRDCREKKSKIVSSIFILRFVLWLITLGVYVGIISVIPICRNHFLLFMFSYGLTFNELLFPQYYFLGIEKMKFITLLNLAVRGGFILLIFLFIKSQDDYVYVPLFTSLGYCLGGVLSLYIIFVKEELKFVVPLKRVLLYYLKDAFPVFLTNVIASIKDKTNYLILASSIGVSEVVIYDLAVKIANILSLPSNMISMVLLPRMALKVDKSTFMRWIFFVVGGTIFIVAIFYVIIPYVSHFFLSGEKDVDLLPIRLYLIVPIILSGSSFISYNLLLSGGYNKYLLYSMIVAVSSYLFIMLFFAYFNMLNSIYSFVFISIIAYFVELVYRFYLATKIFKKQ